MLLRHVLARSQNIVPKYTRVVLRSYSQVPVPSNSDKKNDKNAPPPPVSYEYPDESDSSSSSDSTFRPKESTAFKKHIPFLAGVAGILWAVYAFRHFMSEEKSVEQKVLAPDHFTPFKITHKEYVTPDVALIELSPKYDTHRDIIKSNGGFWNGKKLWSIEVKQPEIQVVRRYTPLPMYFMQHLDEATNQRKSLLRLLGSDKDEGRMVLMIKRYDQGEVSRYLHSLPVGSDVEIRGPYTEYKFPYSPIDVTDPRQPMLDVPSRMEPENPGPSDLPAPENIAFFAGGTGIASALQCLLSSNPPRGQVDVYYSVRNRDEIPVPRFMLFLEKTGRARFHYYVDNEKKFISAKDIPKPKPMNYVPSKLDSEHKDQLEREAKVQKLMQELRKEKETLGEFAAAPVQAPEPSNVVKTEPVEIAKTESPVNARLKYHSLLEQIADSSTSTTAAEPSIAVVCGPMGYLCYVAGSPGLNNDQPISGLLGKAGWTTENTIRMEP